MNRNNPKSKVTAPNANNTGCINISKSPNDERVKAGSLACWEHKAATASNKTPVISGTRNFFGGVAGG